MNTYAYGVMLPPGNADRLRRFSSEVMGPRKAEHDEYLRRFHLIKQYGWLQSTPMGDMVVVYLEATDDFIEENRKFAASTHPFDVWYKGQLHELLGQDLSRPFPPDFVEVVYESHDVPPTGGEQPFAIAAMVQPGKTDALRRLIGELLGPRNAEFRDAHRRFGQSVQNLYLEHTPQGDLTVYYDESPNSARALQEFGESRNPFDVWWKEQLLDITGIDYSQPFPGPLPELVLSATLTPVGAAH